MITLALVSDVHSWLQEVISKYYCLKSHCLHFPIWSGYAISLRQIVICLRYRRYGVKQQIIKYIYYLISKSIQYYYLYVSVVSPKVERSMLFVDDFLWSAV